MRHDFSTYQEMSRARQECDSNQVEKFESDIPPELKVLSEHYYNKSAPTLNVTLLDIEVDYNREVGFSSVANPYAVVNSIAMYHTWENRMIAYAIPPNETPTEEEFIAKMNEIEPLPKDVDIEVHFCKDERELLLYVLAEIEDSDMLCGWNSDFFDVPYLGKRMLQVLGPRYFKQLSFPLAGEPRWRKVERFNVEQEVLDLQGRLTTDYLDLFRKYEVAERPSYKLESIADEVLPDLPKLEYEGSLADLYRKDFAYFVRYNLRDTEILKGFEDTLGYIALANEMFHISNGLCKHVTGTLKLAELAINNYCIHELNVRVPDNEIDDESQSIQGAYVLEPRVGLHEWIGSIDISSLYPSSIRSLNISPETLIGQFRECERAVEEIRKESMVTLALLVDDRSEPIEQTAEEWRKTLKANKWAVSGYGTVFDQTKQGVIPAILETWYATRKKYQKLMRESNNAAGGDEYRKQNDGYVENLEHYKQLMREAKNQAAYYDRLQYVYKIKLNSLYGALNNRFFRYFDLRMGESTTGTGRMILKHMCSMAGKLLDGDYNIKAPSVIYGDTDSVYFETSATNKEEAVLVADSVAAKINETFTDFMRETFLCTDGFDNIIQAGREVVADRGIFVDKKRYVLHVVDNEGQATDKLKVMGLDTKKTTLPKEVSKQLNKFVERFLKGEEWDVIANDIVEYKEELRNTDQVMTIGLPKGVKKVEEYTDQYKIYGEGVRLPGHVAASIFYNQCLKEYNDRDSLPIVSGTKIKVFYLMQKQGRFKSIALPTDAQQVPDWFLDHFMINRDMHIERLVDNPLNNIIKAIGKETPSKQSLVVDELLDF
jgi:DNA polymerase elongation subunit (family B)